jgi:ubiquinol-cytochrome c reductase cytochrome b subunit
MANLDGLGGWLDDRLHGARPVRNLMNKVFPDHWTFMLGEVALWTFVIELLTGTYLALFFVPSLHQVVYHGSYVNLNGISMSEAYQSTLRISFDVRGGLLIRQIHHWSADVFVAAMSAHLLRHFFLGSYRKPRDINWLIGIVIYAAALVEGLFGYSLPDDQLSGAGLRIFEGVLQGIPIIGTYTAFFLFGGQYPGTDIEPRMYILHVLLIPGLILALVSAHIFISFHQKHTAMPLLGNSEHKIRGQTFYPYFALKGTAWFFAIFGVIAALATFAQINPIWLYGPYNPLAISSASQPDWYLGILEGALRAMPAWEINFLGHTLSLSVFIPFALPLGLILGGAALWPFFERWVTRDNAEHHINDRPRNAPVRTGIGVAAVVFYGVLWAEGGNDVIADKLQIPLYTVTWVARVLVIAGPVVAFTVTRRVCLARQRRDRQTLEHGVETGIIRQQPDGGFTEVLRPVTDEERAVLAATPAPRPLPLADASGIPAPDRSA